MSFSKRAEELWGEECIAHVCEFNREEFRLETRHGILLNMHYFKLHFDFGSS